MTEPRKRQHWTVRTRDQQIERVKELLVQYGGWANIAKGKNERWFTYICADELGVTFSKAKEYIDVLVNASIARTRMQKK